MEDREFNEVDLRTMLERASGFRPDIVDGRWLVESWHQNRRWDIIVEPDTEQGLLVVVTAYPIWEK